MCVRARVYDTVTLICLISTHVRLIVPTRRTLHILTKLEISRRMKCLKAWLIM